MTESVLKELLVRYLLVDNIQQLKLDDTQKTIILEGEDATRFIDQLEQVELQIRYCRLCECIITDGLSNESHV